MKEDIGTMKVVLPYFKIVKEAENKVQDVNVYDKTKRKIDVISLYYIHLVILRNLKNV